ncbi:MAG: hypothetical protein ACSHW0_10795 [Thalassotalea sp.]
MTNIAGNIRFAETLEKMRNLYDQQVEHWIQKSVKYNGYAEYGQLFDRHLNWASKQQILLKKNNKNKKSINVSKG